MACSTSPLQQFRETTGTASSFYFIYVFPATISFPLSAICWNVKKCCGLNPQSAITTQAQSQPIPTLLPMLGGRFVVGWNKVDNGHDYIAYVLLCHWLPVFKTYKTASYSSFRLCLHFLWNLVCSSGSNNGPMFKSREIREQPVLGIRY